MQSIAQTVKIPQKDVKETRERKSVSDEKAIYLHTIVNLSDIDIDFVVGSICFVRKTENRNWTTIAEFENVYAHCECHTNI